MQSVTLTSLSTSLPNPLQLCGCEVALEVLEMPAIITMFDAEVTVRDGENPKQVKLIPGGNFANLPEYIQHLHREIGSPNISVTFEERTQKAVVNINEKSRSSIQFHHRIPHILKLPTGVIRQTFTSAQPLQRDFSKAIIALSEMVERTHFSNLQLPVLHVHDGKSRRLQFHRAAVNEVSSINIELYNRSLERLQVLGNNYLFVLHYRPA